MCFVRLNIERKQRTATLSLSLSLLLNTHTHTYRSSRRYSSHVVVAQRHHPSIQKIKLLLATKWIDLLAADVVLAQCR